MKTLVFSSVLCKASLLNTCRAILSYGPKSGLTLLLLKYLKSILTSLCLVTNISWECRQCQSEKYGETEAFLRKKSITTLIVKSFTLIFHYLTLVPIEQSIYLTFCNCHTRTKGVNLLKLPKVLFFFFFFFFFRGPSSAF